MSDFASLSVIRSQPEHWDTQQKKKIKPFRFNFHLLFSIEILRISPWYLLFLEVLPRLNFWTQQWKSQNGRLIYKLPLNPVTQAKVHWIFTSSILAASTILCSPWLWFSWGTPKVIPDFKVWMILNRANFKLNQNAFICLLCTVNTWLHMLKFVEAFDTWSFIQIWVRIKPLVDHDVLLEIFLSKAYLRMMPYLFVEAKRLKMCCEKQPELVRCGVWL